MSRPEVLKYRRREIIVPVLEDKISKKKKTNEAIAEALMLPVDVLKLLLAGECPITRIIAIRLAKVFARTNSKYWLDLEKEVNSL